MYSGFRYNLRNFENKKERKWIYGSRNSQSRYYLKFWLAYTFQSNFDT